MTVRTTAWLAFLFFVPLSSASAQFFDQLALADFLNRRAESLSSVPETSYSYYQLSSNTGNSVYARNNFFMDLGEGHAKKGQEMAMLVGLLNRTTMNEVYIGDTLVVPTHFDLDFRAYSPFPRYYTGGRELDKLFIMDKTLQAFAAYEYGELVRWGIINTGNPDESPTPNGRYNFNWREEFRVSSLSPPGEEWQMYWVVNFHQARGMHIHQYEMPTGGPTSHGCVRLVDADAEWAYNWVNTWKTTAKGNGFSSGAGRILEQGTTVLVIGTEPEGSPEPFEYRDYGPALRFIDLPAHPYDVPPGTPQQKHFDRRRPALPAAALAADEPPAEAEDPVMDTPTDDAVAVAERVPDVQDQAVDEEAQPVDEEEKTDDALQPLPFVDEHAIDAPLFAAQESPAADTTTTDNQQPVDDTEALVADDLVADNRQPEEAEQNPEESQQADETVVADAIAIDADKTPVEVEQPDEELAEPVEAEVIPQTILDLRQTSWTIVAASHATQEAALEEAAQYRAQIESNGSFINVVEMTSGGETPYRVVIGQFETLAATLKAQAQLSDDIPNSAWQYYLEPIANDVHYIDEAPPALAAAEVPADDQPTEELSTEDQAADDQSTDQAQALPMAVQQADAEGNQADDTTPLTENLTTHDEQPEDAEALIDEEQPVDDTVQDIIAQDSLTVADAQPVPEDTLTVADTQPDDNEPLAQDSLLVVETQADESDQQPSNPPAHEEEFSDDVTQEMVAEAEAPAPARFDRERTSWTIIVASFIAEADAHTIAAEYRKQLQSMGYVVDVINAESAGETLFRVVVGQFESLVASTAAQQELAPVIPFDSWLFYVNP